MKTKEKKKKILNVFATSFNPYYLLYRFSYFKINFRENLLVKMIHILFIDLKFFDIQITNLLNAMS